MLKNLIFFALLLLPRLGHAFGETIPVVGLDKNQQEVSVAIPKEQFQKNFSQVVTTIQDSTLIAIENKERIDGSVSDWLLRDVVVGIGLNLTAGLGPIYHVTAAPRIRACFSNSTHPRFPD